MSELNQDKEQLKAAKALILKQKEQMLLLVKKMRDMNAELKELKAG